MATFPSKGSSLWAETTPETGYEPLKADMTADVAIVGAGIAGLTAAYFLKQRGKRVIVVEKSTIGQGVSGFTTGKVTSQHGAIYTTFIKDFGTDIARLYGEANQAAIEQIEKIISDEKIDCDWRRADNYVFTEKDSEVEKLRQEASDAAKLGLPASFETSVGLPTEVKGAVKFSNQATFHIGKYLAGLAKAVHGNGSFVFEHTKASRFNGGDNPNFDTPEGKVNATDIIIATNVPTPIIMHTAYAGYVYPARSYIVAGRYDGDLTDMYINTGKPSRSLLPVTFNGEKWLLVGGEGHIVGLSGPAAGRYKTLETYAKEHFGVIAKYRWSTWDYVAYDGLPLVGKAYPHSKHIYMATGFRKWGLSNGTAAAMILADQLMGKQNTWAPAFRSNRLSAITSLPKGTVRGIFQ